MSHASKSSDKGPAPFSLKLPPKTHKSTTNKRSSGTGDSGSESHDDTATTTTTMPAQPTPTVTAAAAQRVQHTDEQIKQMLSLLHKKYMKSGPRALMYGTAGFRDKAEYLDWVMFRMGILAALRSKSFKGAYVGVMITASHNPAEDNGVKLIDASGAMLDSSWENEANYMVMCHDDNLGSQINGLLRNKTVDFGQPGNVLVGRDTRASSPALAQAVRDGVASIGCTFHDCGLLTTPQLHFLVALRNKPSDNTDGSADDKTENAYYASVRGAFNQLFRASAEPQQATQNGEDKSAADISDVTGKEGDEHATGGAGGASNGNNNYQSNIRVDCANGIGALKLKPLADMLMKDGTLKITLTNTGEGEGDVLNEQCGADFVKIQQAVPRNFENAPLNSKCASFDGDADRLIYFYVESNADDATAAAAAVHRISPNTAAGAAAAVDAASQSPASSADIQRTCHLLDGDKIATLLATYIIDKCREADIEDKIRVGVVQTAYANGASTHYLRERMRMQVDFVPTGVKYLHKQAHEYDIGIYFEANGHGTVLFGEECLEVLHTQHNEDSDATRSGAARDLLALSSLINQTTGDAICDMLAVEVVLAHYGWSIADWDRMYVDLPNRQLKVTVQDRRKVKTANAERRCTEPPELQAVIDRMVKEYAQARAFVRPSGTEDVIRVYAEASTRESADELAFRVAEEVWCKAGGVGVRPEPSAQYRRCAATVVNDSLIS